MELLIVLATNDSSCGRKPLALRAFLCAEGHLCDNRLQDGRKISQILYVDIPIFVTIRQNTAPLSLPAKPRKHAQVTVINKMSD